MSFVSLDLCSINSYVSYFRPIVADFGYPFLAFVLLLPALKKEKQNSTYRLTIEKVIGFGIKMHCLLWNDASFAHKYFKFFLRFRIL